MQIYFSKHRCLDEYLSVPIFFKTDFFFAAFFFLVNNAWKHCWWISQTISYPFFSSCFISFSKTFSFLSSDLVFRASVKHWWCLTYKGNLCPSLLVPPCLSAFSCPCSPPQMSHRSGLMLVEDRQKMQGKCITLPAQKHRTYWRQVNNIKLTCKESTFSNAAPSRLSPYIANFTHFQKMCQFSILCFPHFIEHLKGPSITSPSHHYL